MADNVLDVLIYLFENWMVGSNAEFKPEFKSIKSKLQTVGFSSSGIVKALRWIFELKNNSFYLTSEQSNSTFRIFSPDERKKLGSATRHALYCLERDEVITAASREIIIDRAMALDLEEVDQEQLKWILLFVLFFHGQKPLHVQRMENTIMLDGYSGTLH